MSKEYKTNNYEDAVVLKAALCSRYPDAADAINDIYKMSDDGWVDAVTEDEDKGILMFHGLIEGAPTDWTIDFSGELIIDEVEEMEDDTMKNVNEEMAVTEEMTIGAKVKAFAEGTKDKVVDATKKVASTLSCIEEEAVKISSMNNTKAEAYIAENAVEVLEKFKNDATKLLNNIGIIIEENPELEGSLRKKAKSLSEFIEVIQDTLDEEGVNGWSKFKSIMKEVAKFVLGLILKAAAIVLKIAFTLVVGAIKIGATGLVTVGKVVGVVNREVVKPTTKDIKTTWANRKKKAEAEDDAEVTDDDFDEIEEKLFQ